MLCGFRNLSRQSTAVVGTFALRKHWNSQRQAVMLPGVRSNSACPKRRLCGIARASCDRFVLISTSLPFRIRERMAWRGCMVQYEIMCWRAERPDRRRRERRACSLACTNRICTASLASSHADDAEAAASMHQFDVYRRVSLSAVDEKPAARHLRACLRRLQNETPGLRGFSTVPAGPGAREPRLQPRHSVRSRGLAPGATLSCIGQARRKSILTRRLR